MFVQGLLLLSFVSFFTNAFVYTEEAILDQVTELPGLQNSLSYNQFSGYIQLPGTKKYIHYWLVEAEQDADLMPT